MAARLLLCVVRAFRTRFSRDERQPADALHPRSAQHSVAGVRNVALSCGLLLLATALSACKSVDHTETAAQPSTVLLDAATTSERSSEADPSDDSVFVSKVVGFSIRKPSSWHFRSTRWRAAELDQLRYKSEDLAQLVRENATDPLVVIIKYGDTVDPIGGRVGHLVGASTNLTPIGVRHRRGWYPSAARLESIETACTAGSSSTIRPVQSAQAS
jgi:hypothetical protein